MAGHRPREGRLRRAVALEGHALVLERHLGGERALDLAALELRLPGCREVARRLDADREPVAGFQQQSRGRYYYSSSSRNFEALQHLTTRTPNEYLAKFRKDHPEVPELVEPVKVEAAP